MLGISDPQVWLAYVLSILSAVLCVGYGVSRWNKGDDAMYAEDKKWIDGEKEIEDEL